MAAGQGHEDGRSDVSSDIDEVPLAGNAEALEMDIRTLSSYYFISVIPNTTVFDMHRLVQHATKKWLKANRQLERWGSQFIYNLYEVFPTGSFDTWELCRSLFPHAIAAFHTEVASQKTILRQASLLLRSGNYASTTGAYADAERMQRRSLDSRKQVLGKGHLDTLGSMNNLALTYSRRGKWDKAEKLQVEVMAKRKVVLGEGHPSTLTSINNLALMHSRRGQCDKAEKLQEEVMEKRKMVLREGHPDTLTSISNLAATYSQ